MFLFPIGRNRHRLSVVLRDENVLMESFKVVMLASQTYAMLGNETMWEVAQHCHRLLDEAAIPHAIVGGVAVCLHGYPRNTVDVDLLVRSEDGKRLRDVLEQAGFEWIACDAEFRSEAGIPVQLLLAGERAGKGSEVRLPDPASSKCVTIKEGLPVLSLARLIEAKLACGEGSVRRTHKDFADVVELIVANRLGTGFARFLHKSVRGTFRELVTRTRET